MIKYALFLLVIPFFIGCDDYYNEDFSTDDFIKLDISDTADLKADGQSLITLTATLLDELDNDFKKVTFSTTEGEFVGLGLNTDKKSIIKYADEMNNASVLLQLGTKPGVFYVSASISKDNIVYLQEGSVFLGELDVDDIISVEIINPSHLVADGISTVQYQIKVTNNPAETVSVESNLPLEGQNNVFSLINGNVNINQTIANESKEYYLKVTISDPNVYKRYSFVPTWSYPEDIICEPSVYQIDTNDNSTNVLLKTYLVKDIGKVTKGSLVEYKAFQLDDSNQPIYFDTFSGLQSAKTDINGSIEGVTLIVYKSQLLFDRPIIIKLKTLVDSVNYVEKEIQLHIV
jgi:hypothetical protein